MILNWNLLRKIVQQLEYEETESCFLTENSDNIIFTYIASPPILNINKAGNQKKWDYGAILLRCPVMLLEGLLRKSSLNRLTKKIREATREMPHVVSEYPFS